MCAPVVSVSLVTQGKLSRKIDLREISPKQRTMRAATLLNTKY